MIKDKLGHRLDDWIHAIFPFLFRRAIDPNLLTVLGTLVCVAAAAAFGAGEFVFGGLLLALGGFCDLVDGVVARHFGRTSAFGAFLDSTLDRFVDMIVLLALSIHYAEQGDRVTSVLAGVVLVASVLTSYTKARAEALDLSLPGGFIERGERITLLILGGIFGFMEPALWVLGVGATATVVQRFQGASRGLAERKQRGSQQVDEQARGGEQLAHGE